MTTENDKKIILRYLSPKPSEEDILIFYDRYNTDPDFKTYFQSLGENLPTQDLNSARSKGKRFNSYFLLISLLAMILLVAVPFILYLKKIEENRKLQEEIALLKAELIVVRAAIDSLSNLHEYKRDSLDEVLKRDTMPYPVENTIPQVNPTFATVENPSIENTKIREKASQLLLKFLKGQKNNLASPGYSTEVKMDELIEQHIKDGKLELVVLEIKKLNTVTEQAKAFNELKNIAQDSLSEQKHEIGYNLLEACFAHWLDMNLKTKSEILYMQYLITQINPRFRKFEKTKFKELCLADERENFTPNLDTKCH